MSGELEHPLSVVNEVAGHLAAGGSAEAVGTAVYVAKPDGGTLFVRFQDAASAQGLLDAATAAAATTDFDPIRKRVAVARATLAATNRATILHERNRWLTETDPYVLPVSSLPGDLPGDVLGVLAAQGTPSVQDQLRAWRQQLRDYPATVTDWTNPPPLPAPPNITLPSGRALIIVT